MNVVELEKSGLFDVSVGLRNLADSIDRGDYGDVVNVAWVLDAEYKPCAAGLLGKAANPDAVFVLLLECAKVDTIRRMGK